MKKINKPTHTKATVDKPLVSVIMPVKDVAEFVAESVESIRNQTVSNWELIVIDDGSNDGTGKILTKLAKIDKRIKIITHNISRGIGASLNEALKICKGRYIARMDGDDISLPNRFALQIEYLAKNKEVVAVGGQAQMIDGKGSVFAMKNFPTSPKTLREMIMWVVPIQHPILMARANIYKKCRYDEKLRTAEDVDIFMQLLMHGEFANVVQTIYQYRKADTSNGYHNVKLTFYLTLLGRIRGVTKYGYKPTIKGIFLTLLQLIVVTILPSKSIVRLYEAKRFIWVIKEYLGKFAFLSN